MSFINDVINISVQNTTATILAESQNTLLFIGITQTDGDVGTYRVKEYTSITSVVPDYAVGTPEYKAALLYFSQAIKPSKILIGQMMADDGNDLSVAYTAIKAIRNDFYAVTLYDKTPGKVLQLAQLVEADERKIFATCDNTAAAFNSDVETTSLSYILKNANLKRSFVFANKTAAATDYPECAWLGLMLSYTIGSATFALKTLSGVTADKLTDAERTRLRAKNANYFTYLANVPVTYEGTMADGGYIDLIVGSDWIVSNIQTNLANLFISNRKIPYTTQGIESIKGNITTSLYQAANADIVDKASIVVEAPEKKDIAAAQIANRNLPDVNVYFTVTSAIHKVSIQLNISL